MLIQEGSMKEKRVLRGLMVLAVAFLLVILQAPRGESADKIRLRFSTMFPATHLHTVLNQKFAEEIKKRTNGQVEITVFPVGTLNAPE
jgi:TRAP-type C4-dicarboxylate transport system substrate-binding protein